MNCTDEPLACSAAAVRASSGVSFWQGMHHEAKKLSTTGRCRSAPRASSLTGGPPVTEGMEKPGAWSPAPTTGPDPDPEFEEVPRPTNRNTARATAMTQPMSNARSFRGPAGGGVGAEAGVGTSGGPEPSAGGAGISSVSVPGGAMVSAW